MGKATKDELAKIIRDLLTIAKVAQPPSIFSIDPRVKKAHAYLIALGDPSPHSRPPKTGPDPLAELFPDLVDLRPVNGSKMVVDWDLVDGILVARENGLSQDDGEALNFIVREWLTVNGYLAAAPASEDLA